MKNKIVIFIESIIYINDSVIAYGPYRNDTFYLFRQNIGSLKD